MQMLQVKEPTKGHKYRAVPCIVTTDLTLFTADDISALEAKSHSSIGVGRPKLTLRERANAVGIIGSWFGSTKEALRYITLAQHERAGHIRGLTRQVSYALLVGDAAIGAWRSDFDYEEYQPQLDLWTRVVEDTKGLRTDFYRWKKAHVEAQYGFRITET